MSDKIEVWLRGENTPGLVPQLQPAANALLQAREELENILKDLPQQMLWQRPAGVAAIGFHLKHIPGVLDRLLTYAEGDSLSAAQMLYLKNETIDTGEPAEELTDAVKTAVTKAIERYRQFSGSDLTDFRGVGRKNLPSSVIGLCFHAAEHTMRHTGQLLVTVKIVKVSS